MSGLEFLVGDVLISLDPTEFARHQHSLTLTCHTSDLTEHVLKLLLIPTLTRAKSKY